MFSAPRSISDPSPPSGCCQILRSRWSIVAVIITGLAAVMIITFGILNWFGPLQSIGFYASMAGGGTLALISTVGIIVITYSKSNPSSLKPRDIEDKDQNGQEIEKSSSNESDDESSQEEDNVGLPPPAPIMVAQKNEEPPVESSAPIEESLSEEQGFVEELAEEKKTPVVAEKKKVVRSVQKLAPRLPLLISAKAAADLFSVREVAYVPNPAVIQFVIADYVGGGKGNKMDAGVAFYRHYLECYCQNVPNDLAAAMILRALSSYFSCSYSLPIEKVVEEIFSRLQRDRYVMLEGGYHGKEAGHTILYELILEEDGTVTFKLTNTGDGLVYHPQDHSSKEQEHSTRDWHFRTLAFKGATLERLKTSQFLEMLVSYRRPRPTLKTLNILFSEDPNASADLLYQAIIQSWPGNQKIEATNSGGGQRGNSCSIQAISKWIKGKYCEIQKEEVLSYYLFIFLAKVSALSDYLENTQNPSSQFILDAVHKISNHAAKMEQGGILPSEFFAEWMSITKKAEMAFKRAKKRERVREKSLALSFPKDGPELSKVSAITYHSYPSSIVKVSQTESYSLPAYRFPQEPILNGEEFFQDLGMLSKRYVAPLMEEMAYRLNLLRALSDCSSFEFEKDIASLDGNKERQEFFTELATLSRYFYYTSSASSTLHPPDSFVVDLMNAWMICFLEARKEGVISKKVLLEWLGGFAQLLERYQHEYIFDSPRSAHRFHEVDRICKKERQDLLNTIEENEPNYSPLSNLWIFYDKPVADKMHYWSPFYYEPVIPNKWRGFEHDEMKQLPETAEFAYEVSQNYFKPRFDIVKAEVKACQEKPQEDLLREMPEEMKELIRLIQSGEISYEHLLPDHQEKISAVIKGTDIASKLNGDKITAEIGEEIIKLMIEDYRKKQLKPLLKQLYQGAASKKEKKTPESRLYRHARNIAFFRYKGKPDRNLFVQKVASFGVKLPHIPYYDLLREGLTLLYGYSDRHLSRSDDEALSLDGKSSSLFGESYYYSDARSDLCAFSPSYYSTDDHNCRLGILRNREACQLEHQYWVHTNRPHATKGVAHYFPEVHLPIAENAHEAQQDLNDRIQIVLSEMSPELPFLKLNEEKEWIAFVQKDPKTYISEMLTFYQSRLHKLAIPDYQSVFEHLLFSQRGFEALKDDQYRDSTFQLLFDFIETSSNTLQERNLKIQTGAAFLLHVQMRWLHIGKFYGYGGLEHEEPRLFKHWETLILKGKENATLGVALCEAVLGAVPSLELDPDFQTNPRYLQLLAKTLILGSIPAKLESKYDPLALEYGFLSFKELLKRKNSSLDVLKEAAEAIFGTEEASKSHWDSTKNRLQLKTFAIDLKSRIMDGNTDFNLYPLPQVVRHSESYKAIFGKQSLLATVEKEGFVETYSLTRRGVRYRIQLNTQKNHTEILKEIDGKFCTYVEKGIGQEHPFAKLYRFWRNEERVFGEHRYTGEIELIGDQQGFHLVKEGKILSEILGEYSEQETLIQQLFDRIEMSSETVIWLNPKTRELSRVQLLSLGLEFEAKENGGKKQLQCLNFPGFCVARNQSAPFLKNAPHTLILENDQGQKKVIVLVKPIQSEEYHPYLNEKISTIPTDPTEWEKLKRHYVVFDLENRRGYPDLALNPKNILPLTVLLSLYLVTKQYRRALDLIQSTHLTTKKEIDSETHYLLKNWIAGLFSKD